MKILMTILVFSLIVSLAHGLQGDVTNDGVVDGKDALKIMMIIEGQIDPPSPEDSFWNLADVYPFPGTNGRILGDGQVTDEDSYRILSYTLGLITLNELIGYFEGPTVLEFEPTSGAPGTEVSLRGLNFVPDSLTDNVVEIGDEPCEVLSALSTELRIRIPAGATSAPFKVITPGGRTTSSTSFVVLQEAPGQLVLPKGSQRSVKDFDIVSSYEEKTPDDQGNFSINVGDDSVHLLAAVPKTGNDNAYFALYVPTSSGTSGNRSMNRSDNVTIDAFTTAVSLIYINPAVMPKDDFPKEQLIETIKLLPETEQLAKVIEEIYPTSNEPLDDPRLREALKAAIEALIAQTPANMVMDRNTVTVNQYAESDLDSSSLRRLDIDALSVNLKPMKSGKAKFEVANRFWTPVEWVSRVVELDPDQFEHGMQSIETAEALAVYDRVRTVRRGIIAAKGLFNVTAFFADLARGIVEALSIPLQASAFTAPNVELERGIYLLRAFSGVNSYIDSTESEFIQMIPDGGKDEMIAFVMNLAGAGSDLMAAVMGEIIPNIWKRVMASVAFAVTKKLIQVGLIDPRTGLIAAGAVGATGLTFGTLWELLNDAFNTAIQAISEELSSIAQASWAKKFMSVAKAIGKTFNIVAKVLTFGRVVDRLATMVTGYPVSSVLRLIGVSVPRVTPLESAIIVVGEVFAVRITRYPSTVTSGETVKIYVTAASQSPQSNEVYFEDSSGNFGSIKAEVTGVKSTGKIDSETRQPESELTVVVPRMYGSASIRVVTPKGEGVSDGETKILRKAFIDSFEPNTGFAAKDSSYSGTEISINGSGFDRSDEVFLGGMKVPSISGSGSRLSFYVPKGATTGRIKIITSDGVESTSSSDFVVISTPPIIQSVSPQSARSGDILGLSCQNISTSAAEMSVQFEYNGKKVYRNPIYLNSGVLSVSMPSDVPEGSQATVTVTSPAGTSNGIEVKKLPGRVTGLVSFEVEPTNEVKADGVFSVAEALQLIQSDLDPFAPPYDDTDKTGKLTYTHYFHTDTETQEEVYDRTVINLSEVSSKGSKGHPGIEKLFLEVETRKILDGNLVDLTKSASEVSLDGALIDKDIEKLIKGIPGALKVEEGDLLGSYKFGEDYADSISVEIGNSATFDIILDKKSAGGDSVLLWSRSGSPTVTGRVQLDSDDNRINRDTFTPRLMFSGGLKITGDHNQIKQIGFKGGILIDGSQNNSILAEADGANKGFVITNGAKYNIVEGSASNCDVGLEISNGAQLNSVSFHNVTTDKPQILGCNTGAQITGSETQHNFGRIGVGDATKRSGTGVIISNGANLNNFQVVVDHTAGDGVVVKGAGTEKNTIDNMSHISYCDGNGIHLFGGAKHNAINGVISHVKGDGVLIEEYETNFNTVNVILEGSDKSGIAVIGKEGKSPQGNKIEVLNQYENYGVAAIYLKNIYEWESPSVHLKDCLIKRTSGKDDNVPAILMENVTGAKLENVTVGSPSENGFSRGLLMKKSSNNRIMLSDFNRCQYAGIQLTDASSNNKFEDIGINSILYYTNDQTKTKFGILIEGRSSNNTFVDQPNLVTSDFGLRVAFADTGVMISSGSNNLIRGYGISKNRTDDIIITGASTSANEISDCTIGNLIINGGATLTTIRNNRFYSSDLGTRVKSPVVIENPSTRKVDFLNNTVFSWDANLTPEMLLVEDASEVNVNQNRFTFSKPAANSVIRIKNAQKVSVVNNYILSHTQENQSNGILVEGGNCASINIGSSNQGWRSVVDSRTGAVSFQLIPSNTVMRFMNNISLQSTPFRSVTVEGNTVQGGDVGILLDDVDACIIKNNEITGNTTGIEIKGNLSKKNLILLNMISNNYGDGILINNGPKSDALIKNMIYDNDGYGVNLTSGFNGHTILEGSIYSNKSGGIKTNNPPKPSVNHVGKKSIVGTVAATLPDGTIVQVYADNGNQGQIFLGQTETHGKAWRLLATAPSGMKVSATATDGNGNTSEFGQYGIWVGNVSIGPMVYTSTRDGNPEVYFLPSTNKESVRLTNNLVADHSPAISPDKQMFVYVTDRNGNPDIWLADFSGEIGPVTDDPTPDYDPAWSPTGDQIVFVSERTGNPEIFVVDRNGGQLTQLTNDAAVDRHPSWVTMGDTQLIAFTSSRSGNEDIWVMNADGSDPRQITISEARDYDPSFSSDGSFIAFVSERDGNPEIYTIATDGSNVQRRTSDSAIDIEPSVGQNNAWIAFTSSRAGDPEIFAMSIENGKTRRITVSLGENTQPFLSW